MSHGDGFLVLRIQIFNRLPKTIGKVGVYDPAHSTKSFIREWARTLPPDQKEWIGRRIIYRAERFHDFLSGVTRAISFDREAADWAIKYDQADFMVCWCKDTLDRYSIPIAAFKTAPVINLGEWPQYRIPLESFKRVENCGPFQIAYSSNPWDFGPRVLPPKRKRPAAAAPPPAAQASSPAPRASKRSKRSKRSEAAQLQLFKQAGSGKS